MDDLIERLEKDKTLIFGLNLKRIADDIDEAIDKLQTRGTWGIPSRQSYGSKSYVCPNCSLVLDEARDSYCPSCGTEILWNEVSE